MPAKHTATPHVSSRAWPVRACLLAALTFCGLLYLGTFHTPWIYDDIDGIRDNPALRPHASFTTIFTASPPDSTPYGRPLVALSLALNYALGGLSPLGYRAFNLAVHLGSALFLASLLRRVVASSPGPYATRAEPIAFWSVLLFAAHPLATTVVTYTVQRAEGLLAFFYLGVLALAARALTGPRRLFSPSLAVVLCAAGMATKETMVTAPLAVLLLHRAAFAASWSEVGRRWRFHLALASTWIVLAACMLTWPRLQSVGFGSENLGALDYLNLQSGAWWHYLGLFFAPWRTAIDYWPSPSPLASALVRGLGFAVLYLGVLIWTWRRSPVAALGLLLPGLVLLPTSSIIPIYTSPVADHRLYLPTAFGLSLFVAFVINLRTRPTLAAPLTLAACATALAVATIHVNQRYRTERTVWETAIARDPGNARAHNNLGLALAAAGQGADAELRFQEALRLRPGYPDAWYNLATLQGRDGRLASSEDSFRRALALRPAHAPTHCNLAVVLARRGRTTESIQHYEQAIRLRPDYPAANFNLAVVYLEAGDYTRALPLARACLRANSSYPKARELVADLERQIRSPQ